MTQQLRDELARLGEQAPDLRVDPDLWTRGRRARRRDQVLTVAAVLAFVAVLGGITSVLTDDRTPAPAESPDGVGGGAVPSVIHLVPERLTDSPRDDYSMGGWDDRVAETDLAIGRASVAFTAGDYSPLPVVVDAVDGTYHPLVLPGWVGDSTVNSTYTEQVGLALSPDGRSLAYAWWDPTAPLDEPMPAGVRVVDLATGDLRSIPLSGGNGVFVTDLVWSPDSRWLVWRGMQTTSWTPRSIGGRREITGRVAPGALSSQAMPFTSEALAVSSEGSVAAVSRSGLTRVWDGRTASRQRGDAVQAVARAAAFSPDGTTVALGTYTPQKHASFVDPATGALLKRPLAKDLGMYPEGADVHVLGWLDDTLTVGLVTSAGERVDAAEMFQLVVMTAPTEPTSRWTYRIVGGVSSTEVRSFAPRQLTVAVDLMTLEHPTEHFPAPEWPMSDERKVTLTGLAVVGLLAAAYLLVHWRRRRA